MSRFCGCDWDGDGPPPQLYGRAVENALRGRKGQAVLRELKDALLALPAPRLIEGAFARDGEVCPLGALAKWRFDHGVTLPWGDEQIGSIAQLEGRLGDDLEDDTVTLELGESMGLKRALAWGIAFENDEGSWSWKSETPEARFTRVMRWVDDHLQPV